jgi:hypothetical protein
MKKGQHIGKIIITIPQDSKDIIATTAHQTSLLSSTSTYLLIGGLGGLGKEVARWMVEKSPGVYAFSLVPLADLTKTKPSSGSWSIKAAG